MTRYVLFMLPILTTIAPTLPTHAETLQEYAAKCDEAMGGKAFSVPAFKCDDPNSTEVPLTHPVDKNGTPINVNNLSFPQLYAELQQGRCDRPDRLNQECDPGSRFHVLVNTPDVYVVAHCRKKGKQGNLWGDIAVIQHNRNPLGKGATCFYQEGPIPLGQPSNVGLKNEVVAPSKANGEWKSPIETFGENCVSCHDNGPVIRSPYLTQITGPNRLPGADDTCSTPDCHTFNKDPQPYSFVGADFASWKAYKVEINGNICNTCHRMGVSNQAGGGTARDFGIRATQQALELHKNSHSPESPLWMIPQLMQQTMFDQGHADQAQAIKICADKFSANLPLPAGCNVTQFAAAYVPPPVSGGGSVLDIATLIGLIQIPLR